jgi:hypothetical protein
LIFERLRKNWDTFLAAKREGSDLDLPKWQKKGEPTKKPETTDDDIPF